jgi:hypothetical protein
MEQVHGVQLGLPGVDALEERPDDFDGGKLATLVAGGKLGGGQFVQGGHGFDPYIPQARLIL